MSASRELFPQGLSGIIFDCDGVMIDSRDSNSAFYNHILSCFGLPPMTREQELYSHMATYEQTLAYLLPADKLPQVDAVISRSIDYERDILPLITLMPGFMDFITEMRALDIPLAVATNRTELGMETVLDFFALHPYFNPVVTATNARPKPDPQGSARICRAWGVQPQQVLMVGDSAHDKNAAAAAGTVFAAFNGVDLQGDLVAADFATLRQELRPWLPRH